jgi:hypothetical protein
MLFMGGSLAVLFPALLVFVVTCLLTAIPAAFVFWLSEKFAIRSILFLCVCRRRYRSIEPSGSAGGDVSTRATSSDLAVRGGRLCRGSGLLADRGKACRAGS